VTNDDYLTRMKEYSDELCKDPVRLKKFLRSVMGPPTRTLEGDERLHVLTLLALIKPFDQSNNQHSWTNYYMIGDTEYQVTSFPGGEEIVDEMLEEEDEHNGQM